MNGAASLEQNTKAAWRRAKRELDAIAVPYRVTSTLRTRQEQTRLYKAWLLGNNPFPVAIPGTSTHEIGIAMDIVIDAHPPSKRWFEGQLIEIMQSHGFKWAGPTDSVHYTYLGPTAGFEGVPAPSRGKPERMPVRVEFQEILARPSHPRLAAPRC